MTKACLELDPRGEIGDREIDRLAAVLRRPCAERRAELLLGEGYPHEIGRAPGQAGAGGVHQHGRDLGLGDERRDGDRVGGEAEAGEEIDLVALNQLLRVALGDFRLRAAIVAGQQHDLAPGDRVAVLAHIELGAILHPLALIGEEAGEGADEADLDRGAAGLVRTRGCGDEQEGEQERGAPHHATWIGSSAGRSSLRQFLVGRPARSSSSSRVRSRRSSAMPASDLPSHSFARSAIGPCPTWTT